jgi:hypothetical protein
MVAQDATDLARSISARSVRYGIFVVRAQMDAAPVRSQWFGASDRKLYHVANRRSLIPRGAREGEDRCRHPSLA